jgi:hypothetical protein
MTSADDMAHCRYCSKWGPCPDHRAQLPAAGRESIAGEQATIPASAEHEEATTPTVASTSPSSLIVERLIEKWRKEADRGDANARYALSEDLTRTAIMSAGMAVAIREKADELEAAFRDLLLRPQEEQQTKEGQ